jgi:hypothetical protein
MPILIPLGIEDTLVISDVPIDIPDMPGVDMPVDILGVPAIVPGDSGLDIPDIDRFEPDKLDLLLNGSDTLEGGSDALPAEVLRKSKHGGSVVGSGIPCVIRMTKCTAILNSSGFNFWSLSRSDIFLVGKQI